MNALISKLDITSSATTNRSLSSNNKRRASAPARSLALASASSLMSSSMISNDPGGVSDHLGHRPVKTTTFDKVFVYEFSLTLGDNPSVREGCPVALGRKCVHKTVIDIESFEQSRRPGVRKRRRAKDLYIPVYDRAALLMSLGFTLEKIVETVLEVERIKKSRQECLKLNGWQKMNVALDSAGRSLFRKFTSGNNSIKNNKLNINDKKTTSLNSDNDNDIDIDIDIDNDNDNIKVGRDRKRGTVVPVARTA